MNWISQNPDSCQGFWETSSGERGEGLILRARLLLDAK